MLATLPARPIRTELDSRHRCNAPQKRFEAATHVGEVRRPLVGGDVRSDVIDDLFAPREGTVGVVVGAAPAGDGGYVVDVVYKPCTSAIAFLLEGAYECRSAVST